MDRKEYFVSQWNGQQPKIIKKSMVMHELIAHEQLANMAEMFYKNQKYLNAIELYSSAIEVNPAKPKYYYQRSKCYKKIKDLHNALIDAENFCELLQIDAEKSSIQERVVAHFSCACLLGELGKIDAGKLPKAESRIKTALRLCQNADNKKQIMIKQKRLKKIIWYKRREKEISLAELEKSLLNRALVRKEISDNDFTTLNEVIEQRLYRWKAPLELPDYMVCKITLELMTDPVVNEAGFAYEHLALKEFYQKKKLGSDKYVDPITLRVVSGFFVNSFTLKAAIEHFLEENPWGYEFGCKDYHEIRMI